MNKEIHAFTIIELLVALMVTSIILLLIVASVQNYTKQYYTLKLNSNENLRNYAKHTLIRKDFLQRGAIYAADDRIRMGDPTDSIVYEGLYDDNLIRRMHNTSDTLNFKEENYYLRSMKLNLHKSNSEIVNQLYQ